jgi:hypothetical protein
MANNSTQSGGIGFFGLLTILFVGLKLGGVINWSWWWVLAPIWGPLCLVLFIILGIFLYVYKTEM